VESEEEGRCPWTCQTAQAQSADAERIPRLRIARERFQIKRGMRKKMKQEHCMTSSYGRSLALLHTYPTMSIYICTVVLHYLVQVVKEEQRRVAGINGLHGDAE
jgi:hypothetical protein